LGLVEGSEVRDVTAALDVLPSYRYPLPAYDPLIANLDEVAQRARSIAASSPRLPLETLRLLSPVANPGKIVAAPLNYKKHVQEVRDDPALHNNNPSLKQSIDTIGLFLKATSSLVGAGEGIALRKLDRRNDHEVELAFVIGKSGNNILAHQALQYVAGYSIGLDITIRGPEGELRQKSNTRNLILGVAHLIEFASAFYTLHPGDIFMTGTPEGVSQISPGDSITASIEKIGSREVKVHAATGVPVGVNA